MEAGIKDREPEYPKWIVESIEKWEEDANRVNALTFERYHQEPWSEIHNNWRDGYLRFLELGNGISERDLLDGDPYAWLDGFSLAAILLASYDHHQEHLQKLTNWLRDR
jgi:hypothetical protein